MEAPADPAESLQALGDVAASTRELFTNSPDIESVAEIQRVLLNREAAKSAALDVQRDNLRALSRQLEAQRAATQRPASAPSEKQHQIKMQGLDSSKFALGKSIAALEQDLALTASALATTRAEATQAEAESGAEQQSTQTDSTVLRLKIYSDLGFFPIADESGNFTKYLISSASKRQLHTQPIDNGESDFVLANKVWAAAA